MNYFIWLILLYKKKKSFISKRRHFRIERFVLLSYTVSWYLNQSMLIQITTTSTVYKKKTCLLSITITAFLKNSKIGVLNLNLLFFFVIIIFLHHIHSHDLYRNLKIFWVLLLLYITRTLNNIMYVWKLFKKSPTCLTLYYHIRDFYQEKK